MIINSFIPASTPIEREKERDRDREREREREEKQAQCAGGRCTTLHTNMGATMSLLPNIKYAKPFCSGFICAELQDTTCGCNKQLRFSCSLQALAPSHLVPFCSALCLLVLHSLSAYFKDFLLCSYSVTRFAFLVSVGGIRRLYS